MKERAARLWGWIWGHRVWLSIILITLLGVTLYGTIYLVRFGLPPSTGQDCGSIDHHYTVQTAHADASLQSLACFWQAYRSCRAATISQTYAGTDAGNTDILTIEQRNNRCVLYGQEDGWVNVDKHTTTFLCTQLSKAGDALQVSACDGNDSFTLEPRNPISESYNCANLYFNASYAYQIPDIEACFLAAYQHCLADMMSYRTVKDGDQIEYDFYIDNHCGIAYSRGYAPPSYDAKLAACASLAMRADGLHFSQCGTDGDVFVPRAPQSLEPVP